MKVELSLTEREADAIRRAHLSVGHGVRRSQALRSAERKLQIAIAVDDAIHARGHAGLLCGLRMEGRRYVPVHEYPTSDVDGSYCWTCLSRLSDATCDIPDPRPIYPEVL